MAYIGQEPRRQTIKYRCPARHEGWTCPSEAVCNAGNRYGKTVRVKQTIDLRRFPPIPWATRLLTPFQTRSNVLPSPFREIRGLYVEKGDFLVR